jgi:hypothetical protein
LPIHGFVDGQVCQVLMLGLGVDDLGWCVFVRRRWGRTSIWGGRECVRKRERDRGRGIDRRRYKVMARKRQKER